MAISGLHIAFAACWLPDSFAVGKFFCLGAGSTANAINWRNLLCCFLCLADWVQPPALRTVVALAMWGMLKLVGDNGVAGMCGYVVWRQFCCGSCCHSLAKFMALCRCGRGMIFWYQWFPCPEWQLPPVLRRLFPSSICNWESHSCLCPCNRHISWH